MLVYLAGSIDALNTHNTFFARARERVRQLGHTSFCPSSAFSDKHEGSQAINFCAIDHADCLFVELNLPSEHVGTLIEVGYAIASKKPVYAVIDQARFDTHSSLWHHGITRLGSVDEFDPQHETPDLEFLVTRDMPDTGHAYAGDAGFDLSTKEAVTIEPGQMLDVPLCGRIAPPAGYWWRLEGRSSTLRKFGLLVIPGIMDGGYRGPCFAACYNISGRQVSIPAGVRIAQAIPHKAHKVRLVKMSNLPPSERGENGFGSSGV